jgi:hypothetical protein
MSEGEVAEVLQRLGVRRVEVESLDRRRWGATPFVGLSIPRRTVYVTDFADPEQILHEAAHLYLRPPPCVLGVPSAETLSRFPEEALLLQWERCMAAGLSVPLRQAIWEWQATTQTCLVGEIDTMLEDVPNYWATKEWRRGYRLLERMGVIDRQRRPTWARPRWGRVATELRRILEREV